MYLAHCLCSNDMLYAAAYRGTSATSPVHTIALLNEGLIMYCCRIEKGAELAAEIRAELVEGRKKLRELADAEKESRKRKRAAALALATVSSTWRSMARQLTRGCIALLVGLVDALSNELL